MTIVGRHLEKLETARETFAVPGKLNTYRCDLAIQDELGGWMRHVRDEMKALKYLGVKSRRKREKKSRRTENQVDTSKTVGPLGF